MSTDGTGPSLAAALERVADTVTRSLDLAGQADKRRWRISLLFLTVGGPLLFALTLAMSFQQGTIRGQEHLLKRGISCLIADQDDHRITNKEAHRQLAQAHGIKIEQVDDILLTPDQAAALKEHCRAFVQNAISQGLAPIAEEHR